MRNGNQRSYYFGNITNIYDLNLDNILLDEELRKYMLVYHVVYKTPYDVKPLHITFNQISSIFPCWWKLWIILYEITFLIKTKTHFWDAFYKKYMKNKISLNDDRPLETTLKMDLAVTMIITMIVTKYVTNKY